MSLRRRRRSHRPSRRCRRLKSNSRSSATFSTALAGRFVPDEIEQKFRLSQLEAAGNSSGERALDARRATSGHSRRRGQSSCPATAAVGVARAQPAADITLSANRRRAPFMPRSSLRPPRAHSLAANAAQPLFDGMTLLNKERSAVAALEQADAQYRQHGHQCFRTSPTRCAPAGGRQGGRNRSQERRRGEAQP